MKKILITLMMFLIMSCSSIPSTPEYFQPKTIVFVHGAWGGAWDYQVMEKLLEDKGHKVYRPTLTGQGERSHLLNPSINLETHIMDILNVIKFEGLENFILVGHSYGGMVITGVADKVPEKIRHLVYMDAYIPLDGENALSLFPQESQEFFIQHAKDNGDGHSLPPFWEGWKKTKDVAHPFNTLLQAISLKNELRKNIPATYVLTIDEGAETDAFSPFAERAKKNGWDYHEWITEHNTQRSMPNEYAELLHNIK